jgi:predicted HTH transcriptional regulator
MLPVNLIDLTPAHIQGLIDSEVAEDLKLEYKSELPIDLGDSKRNFLFEVAAMANSAGGDLLFGIADRDGPDGQNTGIA